jgi:peptidoglycan hydrolase CwlO-like protein
MPPDNEPNISELQARIEFLEEKVLTSIEAVKENQERMCLDITKIKEAVYNPDTGLYARLRAVEEQNKTYSKFLWLILTMAIGAIAAMATAHFG